jgi:hypothetical protein
MIVKNKILIMKLKKSKSSRLIKMKYRRSHKGKISQKKRKKKVRRKAKRKTMVIGKMILMKK